MFDVEHPVWWIVRGNRFETARYNAYDYCEFVGRVDTTRSAAWNKLLALRFALTELRYVGVWWLDYDAYVPRIETSSFAARLAPLELTSLNCVLSLDAHYTGDIHEVNTGVLYLSNSAWTLEFLDTSYNAGYLPHELGGGGCATHGHWEQCAIMWYITRHLRQFAVFPLVGDARCTVVAHGRLQTFPTDANTHHEDALVHHFAGVIEHQPKVGFVARKLAHTRFAGKQPWSRQPIDVVKTNATLGRRTFRIRKLHVNASIGING